MMAALGFSVESTDVSKVEKAVLDEVEADVYWCLTKLLDNIQVGFASTTLGRGRREKANGKSNCCVNASSRKFEYWTS